MRVHMSAAHVTKALRQAGVTVSRTGRSDFRNVGVSYSFAGEFTARCFLEDVAAAGFDAEQWRGRVTVRLPRREVK